MGNTSRFTCTYSAKISRFVDSTHFPRDFLQNTNERINGTIYRISSIESGGSGAGGAGGAPSTAHDVIDSQIF